MIPRNEAEQKVTKDTPLVKVTNLWQRYQIPHERSNTILGRVARAFQMLERGSYSFEEFWALKDISFEVNTGESVGVIGENGSGKSTLLKAIAGIIHPTRGEVIVNGVVAPILELGVGFQSEMSVRDNIRMYASILGMRNADTQSRTDEILGFAGLERFRDASLKHLSSGMQMRLAFSVAIQTNPKIFLVDEGLAVGDLEFQRKCLVRFKEYKEEGKSLVLVSHSLNQIREFCDSAILLSKGEIVAKGESGSVVDAYLKSHAS